MHLSSPLNLGFACAWDADRGRTWSHTPLSLFEALQRRAAVRVVDAPMHLSTVAIALARILYIRRLRGHFVSGWRCSPLSAAAHERAFLQAVGSIPGLDAVLSIGEQGIAQIPTYFYQDYCFSHAVSYMRERGNVLPSFESYSAETLRARVGRWHRKAGDVVLRAIRALLPSVPFPIRFIVAGPQEWPEEGSIPEWVDFLGDASHERLRAELAIADAFAMPSRFEAYGIAPLEALAAGVPVVARNTFAMCEYVRHADNGMLIESDNADACAAALLQLLTDEHMRVRVAEQAANVAEYYSWDRAAADIVRITSGAR